MATFDLPNGAGAARNQAILDHLSRGELDFTFSPVKSTAGNHSAVFQVMTDAVKLGGVRIAAGAKLAQQIADVLGCLLLTPKLLDLTYAARAVTIGPQLEYDPQKMLTSEWWKKHSAAIDAALAKAGYRSGIVQTTGKPWMISNALEQHAGHGENYGWHCPPGTGASYQGAPAYQSVTMPAIRVLQQPGWAHALDEDDYSETVTLVHRSCVVDGVAMDLAKDVLPSKELAPLASHEGPLRILRQPGVPIYACANITPPKGITATDGSDGTTVCNTAAPLPSKFPWGPVLVGVGIAGAMAGGAYYWHRTHAAHRNPLGETTLARKSTGSYRVELVDAEGSYALVILYTGTYASGTPVSAWIENAEDLTRADMRRWMRSHVRGDLDVAQLLANAGFDEYGNAISSRPGKLWI